MKIVSLTIFLLLITVYSFRKDNKKYTKFKNLSSTSERQYMIKKMVLESFLIYGLLGILSLFIIDHSSALMNMPDFLLEYSNTIWSYAIGDETDSIILETLKIFLIFLIPLLLFAGPVFTLLNIYTHHKKNRTEKVMPEDTSPINHLLPRNSKERFWIILLSVNAGFSEEIFFRLLIPIIIFALSGSPVMAILLSSIWFGFAHYYQGLQGIISTTVAGLMLFYVYLLTQSIWITILVHILLDINGLIIAPLFNSFLEQKKIKEYT